jgi:hypothetical protein
MFRKQVTAQDYVRIKWLGELLCTVVLWACILGSVALGVFSRVNQKWAGILFFGGFVFYWVVDYIYIRGILYSQVHGESSDEKD